jgi:hypothetical protein
MLSGLFGCSNALSQILSLIRIHLTRTLVSTHLPFKINLRRTLKARITNLITSWGHYDTNRRRAKGRISSIIKKFEACFEKLSDQFLGLTVMGY